MKISAFYVSILLLLCIAVVSAPSKGQTDHTTPEPATREVNETPKSTEALRKNETTIALVSIASSMAALVLNATSLVDSMAELALNSRSAADALSGLASNANSTAYSIDAFFPVAISAAAVAAAWSNFEKATAASDYLRLLIELVGFIVLIWAYLVPHYYRKEMLRSLMDWFLKGNPEARYQLLPLANDALARAGLAVEAGNGEATDVEVFEAVEVFEVGNDEADDEAGNDAADDEEDGNESAPEADDEEADGSGADDESDGLLIEAWALSQNLYFTMKSGGGNDDAPLH
jgi:hypothetical protein